jgi:HD-like signal output (HDOD) protein
MSQQTQQVLQQLFKAVETDQIKLPTLPEVALKIRQAVEKDNQSAADIAALLSQDTSLSARLLQLANSPLYRARTEIDSLQLAITRLGVRIVKDLVVMLAIKQAFKAHDKNIDRQFKAIWQTSVDVASVCRMLAKSENALDIEHAMLAGLIHNIGALPIIELADRQPELFAGTYNLNEIVSESQAAVGEKILSFWNFPQSLINVVSLWNQFDRSHESTADYVDLVQVAILQTDNAPSGAVDDWSSIPAFKQLDIDPSARHLTDDMQNQLEKTRASLM